MYNNMPFMFLRNVCSNISRKKYLLILFEITILEKFYYVQCNRQPIIRITNIG